MVKFILSFILIFILSFSPSLVYATGESPSTITSDTVADTLNLSAASALLMEASTGTILYEKNSSAVLPPASITKIMTLILIFDALSANQIDLEDMVTVSEYAASMGGSQVFLEAGESQTVDTMIKCIAVSSANDACVAMSEYISGSETAFVEQMNARAAGLGMNNTHFVNCNGLDVDGHVTTAFDVALMSRELISKYPQVQNYTTIWTDTIIHTTQKGSSDFGLSSTNKLLKMYEYATGLKTGSTSLAKYCLSATASKDGIDLIAVIMAAPDHKVRFNEAVTLLNYGYGKCRLYCDENTEALSPVTVTMGISETANCHYASEFRYLDTTGADLSTIQKEIRLNETHEAPIVAGDVAGKAVYSLNGGEIGSVPILYSDSIRKIEFFDCLKKLFLQYSI